MVDRSARTLIYATVENHQPFLPCRTAEDDRREEKKRVVNQT